MMFFVDNPFSSNVDAKALFMLSITSESISMT
jgi:hypothetical protein